MKDPKTNKQKKKDGTGESVVLGFCPYCKILSPTLTATTGRIRTQYTIGCICKESDGKQIKSYSRDKAIKKWREQHVD